MRNIPSEDSWCAPPDSVADGHPGKHPRCRKELDSREVKEADPSFFQESTSRSGSTAGMGAIPHEQEDIDERARRVTTSEMQSTS